MILEVIGEEADPVAIGGKQMHRLNDSERGNDPLPFEVNGENNHPQTKILEDLFDDNKSVSVDSLRSKDLNEADGISLPSSKKEELRHSSSVQMTISDVFEPDEDFYTDKNVLECDMPQLTASYKETSNDHIVKDICVDEVVNVKEKFFNEGCKGGTLTKVPKYASFVEKELPVEEFGTRSFLRSFISSFEDQGNKPLQPLHQDFSEDEVSKSPASISAEADPKGHNQPANIPYDSKIENESITFDFKYPAPAELRIKNGRMETIKEQVESGESRNFLDNTNLHADDISDTRITSVVQSSSKMDNSNGLSTRTVDPHDTKKDHENLDDLSIFGPSQHGEGESSFSAGALATYSGPIPHSGDLSIRSDSSVTSVRSFAFPILQSEWNSSPVRMAKGDGGHFRKHRGWRSGLLCCRF